ncbi:ethylene-responsive transcription factor 3-like [Hibiscus syriacus]|uniref:glucan endo-1,3-beta-D-glucosidase n=1 Tax=Hibiscus syriacus TaxID=106335 RepID=A0A6A3CXA0_HIBSY|nr:ethylene-responsive transcription factor 3-like [Hibiscus syriacus]
MASRAFYLLVSAIFLLSAIVASDAAGSVGINYGRVADNLPSQEKVAGLLKTQGINKVKLYDTSATVLTALAKSGISVVVALPNELLAATATDQSAADNWVQSNVTKFYPQTKIEAIAVGNEVFVDPKNTTRYLVPAMKNIHASLVKSKLDSAIKISSPIAFSALKNSYPSSAGLFKQELVEPVIKPMLDFLKETGSYLMVNAYPFFAYSANSDQISLDYALFKDNTGVVDSGNGLKYHSLFEAQIDAVFADSLPCRLSNTTTPYDPLNVYLFALFNENQKPGPTSERNYGLIYPNEQKVYNIPLTREELKGGQSTPVNTNTNRVPLAGEVSKTQVGQTWCIANGKADRKKLQDALDYECGDGGSDCNAIQPGATCYNPNSLEAHASYAFNSYYQKKTRAAGTCEFGGAAYVVSQRPAYGNCEFPTGGH